MPDRTHDNRAVGSRSRSPARQGQRSHRERSPHRHARRHRPSPSSNKAAKELPNGSRQLSKQDYALFRPMFGLYLDIQKQKILDDMDELEAKGRWKSFIGKWNRGELAEGWYDPSTLQKAMARSTTSPIKSRDRPAAPLQKSRSPREQDATATDDDSDSASSSSSSSSIGPALPGKGVVPGSSRHGKNPGPRIPTTEDLQLRDEEATQTYLASKSQAQTLHRLSQHDFNTTQKSTLDDFLLPRPDPGSHARKVENRGLTTAKLREVAETKTPGLVEEVPDGELFGGEGGAEELGRRKEEGQRRRNEREVRREEMVRARREEREERLGEYRRREEETMGMLREMARRRFG